MYYTLTKGGFVAICHSDYLPSWARAMISKALLSSLLTTTRSYQWLMRNLPLVNQYPNKKLQQIRPSWASRGYGSNTKYLHQTAFLCPHELSRLLPGHSGLHQHGRHGLPTLCTTGCPPRPFRMASKQPSSLFRIPNFFPSKPRSRAAKYPLSVPGSFAGQCTEVVVQARSSVRDSVVSKDWTSHQATREWEALRQGGKYKAGFSGPRKRGGAVEGVWN